MRRTYEKMLEERDVFLSWSATGSRVIVSPPPANRDEDWIVLVDSFFEAEQVLDEFGFVADGHDKYGSSEFRSFRKGDLNLILTPHAWLYDRYLIATDTAKRLNLTKREDRVRLFELIRNVNRPAPFEGKKRKNAVVETDMHPIYWDRSNVGGY